MESLAPTMIGRWGGDRWVGSRWSGASRPATFTATATTDAATLAASVAFVPQPATMAVAATTAASTFAGTFAFTAAPTAAFGVTAATTAATLASVYTMVGLPAAFGVTATTTATLAGMFAYTAPGAISFAVVATTAPATLVGGFTFTTAPAAVFGLTAATTAAMTGGYTAVGLSATFGFAAATTAAMGSRYYFVIPELGLKPALVAALLTSTEITAMTGTRIYPYVIPQSVSRGLPSISYWFIGTDRDRPMSAATDPAKWPLTRVRFHIQSSRYSEVKTLTKRVRNRFLGMPGNIMGIRVAFVTAENDADGYEPPLAGGDLGMYYTQFDLKFKHQEMTTPYIGPAAEGDTLEQVVLSALLTSTAVTNIAGTRIYPHAVPQSVGKGLPTVSYWLVSTVRESYLDGPTGWAFVRIRFWVQSARVDQVEALKYHVRNRFEWLPDNTGEALVSFIVSENDNDGYEPPLQGGDLGTHHAQFDLRFKHHEEMPTHV